MRDALITGVERTLGAAGALQTVEGEDTAGFLYQCYSRAEISFTHGDGSWLTATGGGALPRFFERHRSDWPGACSS